MILACVLAAAAAVRLDRHLPPAANQITAPATTSSGPAQAESRAPSAISPRS
jgi:hypothetical protein